MESIAHVLPTIARSQGGPSVSVRRLVESLADVAPEVDWGVFAGDSAAADNALSDWRRTEPLLFSELGPKRFGWSPRLGTALLQRSFRLIHVHGLWRGHTWAAGTAARRQGIPLIVSPRGMLEPWALRRGRLQKWIVNRLFQRRLLARAACVVATSELEAAGIRQAGVTCPICVIPNGVDASPALGRAFTVSPLNGAPRVALFLSRIHPKKGVLDLVEAWSQVRPVGWKLRIVGPSELGHVESVRAEIGRRQLADVVELAGPLWGEAKQAALAAAELFVLPSYSENFGLAIGEAMAAGLPVITTRATPWEEIESERCGWWTATGVPALTKSLRDATGRSRVELAQMGARGASLIQRRYDWETVARRTLEVYRDAMKPSNAL